MNLNKSQKEAVETNSRKAVVIAGSGSGKTRCIIERINYLLDSGVPSNEIVAITFTNLAASEMKSRINCDSDLFIGTIHSYANKHLIEAGRDTSKAIKEEKFNILLSEALKIQIDGPKHMLVDELQDICKLEFDFIMHCQAENYFFVGDDWQAIYGFKGADVNIFKNLTEDSEWEAYFLSENYRTGVSILKFAEAQIRDIDKIPKKVDPQTEYFGKIEMVKYDDVIDAIEDRGNYKDWFILTRTNKEIEIMSAILKENDIPFVTFKKRECTLEEIEKYLKSNVVKLLTVHAAKGLESENVAVIGMNKWNDEEKRIAYVGATRAKKRLLWVPKFSKTTEARYARYF